MVWQNLVDMERGTGEEGFLCRFFIAIGFAEFGHVAEWTFEDGAVAWECRNAFNNTLCVVQSAW
jgi:hypothetical protein